MSEPPGFPWYENNDGQDMRLSVLCSVSLNPRACEHPCRAVISTRPGVITEASLSVKRFSAAELAWTQHVHRPLAVAPTFAKLGMLLVRKNEALGSLGRVLIRHGVAGEKSATR